MDDQAILPTEPDIQQTVVSDMAEANQSDLKTAQAYWHPAWSRVEQIFTERLAAYRLNGALAHQDVPSDEFKIRMLTDAHVASVIEEIMDEVKRAVDSVESTKRSGD